MDITYFFKGKLAREEASSAFLATLLSQTEDDGIFKANFFKLLGENYDFGEPIPTEIIKKISSDKYKIITEEDEIDITMQGNNNLILIENSPKEIKLITREIISINNLKKIKFFRNEYPLHCVINQIPLTYFNINKKI